MADNMERGALVQYNVYSRVVCFTEGRLPAIITGIRRIFSDVLPPVPDLIIRMKREEFVDVREDEIVPDRSILKISHKATESLRREIVSQEIVADESGKVKDKEA
ncbi:hypothetical protein GBAR_LOCUS8620 [Geodia barretti]|uniref:Uncharacterized protein n=1 Tax=Geodia barretti TaxID=519541 RepID=A0AA35RBP5_GEOBA|nr:hypothetical protein GBAR_LOCUS5810 [Geodia barretti]CAI8013637.1 hypothetical protein GBAR_LOCUS8620 [Geodia barretti]